MEASEQADGVVHCTAAVGEGLVASKSLQVLAAVLANLRSATCKLAAAAGSGEASGVTSQLTELNATAAQHAALTEAAVHSEDIDSLESQSQLWAAQFSEQQTALLALLESQSRELAESKQQLALHETEQQQSTKAQSDASTQAQAQERSIGDANSSNNRQHEHDNADQVAATLVHRENRLFDLESEVCSVQNTYLTHQSFYQLSHY
jgi:hypothetical protein